MYVEQGKIKFKSKHVFTVVLISWYLHKNECTSGQCIHVTWQYICWRRSLHIHVHVHVNVHVHVHVHVQGSIVFTFLNNIHKAIKAFTDIYSNG